MVWKLTNAPNGNLNKTVLKAKSAKSELEANPNCKLILLL